MKTEIEAKFLDIDGKELRNKLKIVGAELAHSERLMKRKVFDFGQKSYQETKREKWTMGNSEITIDTWPWIPTFLEIESPTEEEVKSIAKKLGFDWKDA